MRFRAVLMDNDGTLMDFKAAEANAIGSVLDMLGIDDPDAPEVYSQINDRCWKDFEKGIITQKELRVRRFRELIERYGCEISCSVEEVSQAYVDALSRQSILLDGALDVVKKIAAQLPIVILTNGISKVQHGRIDHSELAPYLSGLLISTEVGQPKPAPDMYLKALELLGGLRAEEVLMIGDSLTSDIRGASDLNMPTCWYNPEHKPRPDGLRIDYEVDCIEQMAQIALS